VERPEDVPTKSRASFTLLLSAFLILLSEPALAFNANNPKVENLKVERVSISALKAAGILPQSIRTITPLPISCEEVPNRWGVTISNELYRAYLKRGFSKMALCLALGGSQVYFDPQSGRQLPLYRPFSYFGGWRPLWLSDCYRQIKVVGKIEDYVILWRPTGCTLRYDPSTGLPIKIPNHVRLASGGEAGGGKDEDNESSTVSEDRLRSLVSGK
jgi:hypothetical protein